jgi:hypothetical protein
MTDRDLAVPSTCSQNSVGYHTIRLSRLVEKDDYFRDFRLPGGCSRRSEAGFVGL